MAAVENSMRIVAANFHFDPVFIACAGNSAAKFGTAWRCGKVVNAVWTRREDFDYFSLAPGVSFRQNPAAQLILSRLRTSNS